MSETLKDSFKKASRRSSKNNPSLPLISAKDGIDDYAYLSLRTPLRRQWPHLPLETKHAVIYELQRAKSIKSPGEELTKCLDYLHLILSLSWEKKPAKKINLRTAQRKLDQTHAGMKEVKDKCIELIAAINSSGKSGAVICLDGPPGVGKTSIAKSIAHAMGRPFEVVSMAGVNDAALIRGYSRTYIGASPGIALKAMKKAGVSNPVIILDEGDKAGGDSQAGNPTYAMLELLDPSQNQSFKDHFLGLGYDMSDVLFIMTTNDVQALPSALVDRMEIIALDAYSNEEKIAIAEKYLVPKHLKQCGLDLDQLKIERSAIELLIADYTQEPGVRKLEEHIKSICRKTNTAMQKKMTKQAVITAENVKYLLGPARVYKTLVPQQDMVGAMTGLYYSDIGGGAMPIQVKSRLQEKAQLTITGLPGQMIKESVQNALEMIKHNAARYGIDAQKLDKTHIHMHLPDGASPKDGPSAGIASATAMISSLTGIKTRHDVAMTGEVDLYGNVLPIGGLKQKLQGARKVGAKTVLIPAQNEPDLYDVPDHLQRDLRIIPVTHMDEVLQHAMSAWDFNLQASFQQAANVPDPAPVPAANTPEPPAAQDVENAVRLMAAHPEIMAQALLRISGNKGPR